MTPYLMAEQRDEDRCNDDEKHVRKAQKKNREVFDIGSVDYLLKIDEK